MRFSLVTLFPDACDAYLSASIVGRARKEKKIKVDYQTPRDYVDNKWGKVDERPYGGGPGMVMTALPVVKAAAKALGKMNDLRGRSSRKVVIWLSPAGKQFDNKEADKLAKLDHVVLVCGRYEGIDERAKKILKTLGMNDLVSRSSDERLTRSKHGRIMFKEYAIGEAVYTGGEVPALAIVDAVTRRLPGVLGKDASVEERRIASRVVYTRPETISYKGKKYKVPKVLQTGHHANIDKWREKR